MAAQKEKRPRDYDGCSSLASRGPLGALTSHVVSQGRRPCWKLKTIAKHLTIRQLIIGKGMEKIPLMQEMKKKYPKIQWRLVLAGDEWKWNGTKWKVLWPKGLSHAENEDSILALVTVMEQTILLTGDASEKVEEAVVKDNPHLQFSILKAGHHGSRDVEWRGAAHTRSAKTRVHIVWEAQSLWASESRDFGALESYWRYHFPDGPRRANSASIHHRKIGSHDHAYETEKELKQ